MGAGDHDVPTGGGPARRTQSRWTAPCVVVAMAASLFLGNPADASRAEAQRRAGRAVAARVAAEPGVNKTVPELAVFARALADGRMADATRVADRLVADPPAMAAAADEVGAAQVEGAVRDAICPVVRSLQAAFAGFPSVTGVFVSLLAAFGCPAASTTSTTPGTSTTFGPSTTMGGPTTSGRPSTTLVTTTSPTTNTTMGGPTTSGPTTTLPFCIPPGPSTTTGQSTTTTVAPVPPTTVPCVTSTTTP